MQIIGKIDIEKYKIASSGVIRSDLLIITENQIGHIIRRRGQAFYDKYSPLFAEIAENPDYIFPDEAHENTALACKTFAKGGQNIHLVIRLALVDDDPELENSVITAIIEGERRYRQRLRNKIPLYKSEWIDYNEDRIE